MRLPQLTEDDYNILSGLYTQYPIEFFQNRTRFLIKQMNEYIRDARVFRISIMGETRGGKSEVGSTIAFQYVKLFNKAMEEGCFDKIDLFKTGEFEKKHIQFNVEFVCGSQSDYIYSLRENHKNKKMKFGQVWQIDESKDKIGGIGSMSEVIELRNLNNIVAKFMQAEIWITPLKFETRNAPFGLVVYKKDVKNRVNWCLLYKIENTAKSIEYHFMGWVNIPLHKNEEFRMKYNEKKNQWIKGEIDGTGDPRIDERKKVSKMLSEDPIFGEMNEKGNRFTLSKEQMLAYIETLIQKNKIQNFNEVEKYRIMEDARMRVMMKRKEEEYGMKIFEEDD